MAQRVWVYSYAVRRWLQANVKNITVERREGKIDGNVVGRGGGGVGCKMYKMESCGL
jgi:hypothetical protein